MSDLETPTPADPSGLGPEVQQSLLGKYDLAQKAGGLIAPVLTAVLAFLGSTDQQVATTAPVDGVVASVMVAEGSAVSAGQSIIRIIDPTHLRVTAYVSEADVARVRSGQQAEVYLTALDRTLHGVVQAVVPATCDVAQYSRHRRTIVDDATSPGIAPGVVGQGYSNVAVLVSVWRL